MNNQDCLIKLHTQKAKELWTLKRSGIPIPPTLFVDCSCGKGLDVDGIKDYLNSVASKEYYLRLCFSDNSYPHYYSKLVEAADVVDAIEKLLLKAFVENKTKFDVIIQPLQMLNISGSILVRKNRVLVESVIGAPPTLFRNGLVNSRIVLENNRLILEEYCKQDEVLYWDSSLSRWGKKQCNKSIKYHMISIITYITYQDLSLYEYGIDNQGRFWIFERKSIPYSSYISLETIEDKDNYFDVSRGKYSNVQYIAIPNFSEINNCKKNYKYIINSGAYTAHLSSYLAFNNFACQFRRR